MECSLHPFVAYVIIPVFAFSNAGVVLGRDGRTELVNPVTLGIICGLVLGKPGIFILCLLTFRCGFASFPTAGRLEAHPRCGMGFAMSLFIAGLAFVEMLETLDSAKVGILAASRLAGMIGSALLLSVRVKE